MSVEQLSVNLGTTSPYDNVSALIRGKIVPVIGQSYTIDLDGIGVSFEIETANEKVRGANESTYAITGRELRSEFIYRAVDFEMDLSYNSSKGVFSMPSACEILDRLGLSYSYDAPDFKPTQSGMGWKTTAKAASAGGYSCKVRIREKNVQALLEKLFSWTAEFGKRKICWHVRSGTLYIWELQRATGQSFTVTEAMCPNTLDINKQRVRKFTETTDSNGTIVTTPTGTISGFGWDYADLPFSGSFTWGGANMTYSGGLLTQVTSTQADGKTHSETYTYGTYFGSPCMISKTTITPEKEVVTNYAYDGTREGGTIGTGRAVPALSMEATQSWTIDETGVLTLDPETTEVHYHPLGNGFYGISAMRYIEGTLDQLQHSVSRGSPGGTASQYTEKQLIGWHATTTAAIKSFPGYITAATRLPLESGDLANEYLEEYKNLHGSIESKLSAEVIGQAAMNPVKGKFVFRGIEYFATDVSIVQNKDGKRMSIAGVRWDYDATYRVNTLGFDS